jgi:hypothetical protein
VYLRYRALGLIIYKSEKGKCVSFREEARISCERAGGWPVLSFDGDYYPDIEISIMDRIVVVMLPQGVKN